MIGAGEEVIIIAFTLATEPVAAKAIQDKNNRFVCNLTEKQAAFAPETA